MEEVRKSKHPHLRHIAPVVYYTSWAYAFTNFLIGLGIWHTPAVALSIYPFVRGSFGPHFWGSVFIGMGTLGLFTLATGKWRWVRRIMMLGLMVKSLFFYGLILNISWQLLSIIGIWALITMVQFLTVVYFPKEKADGIT